MKFKYTKPEPVDQKALNIKEFELKVLKTDTDGVLNGIIDLHIKAIRRRREHSNNLEKMMNMTRADFRLHSPLKRAHYQKPCKLIINFE